MHLPLAGQDGSLGPAAADSGAVSFMAKKGEFWGDAESLVRTVFPGAPETGP